MKEIPPVSIVIPTLNEEKYLPLLLESLRQLDAPLQIIVVDGASTDETSQVAKEYKKYFTGDKTLQFVGLNKRGISMQKNIGATCATHELILFCDADSIAPSTLQHAYIVSEFVTHGYVLASVKIVPIEKKLRIDSCRRFFIAYKKYIFLRENPFLVERIYSLQKVHLAQLEDLMKTYVSAKMLITLFGFQKRVHSNFSQYLCKCPPGDLKNMDIVGYLKTQEHF